MTDVIEGELDDVFSLVADRTRLEILRALWEERVESEQRESAVSFSTLRERVGVEDSGRFNYHLDELVPRFVSHDEEGYTLTYAGTQVIGAAVSGIYTETEAGFETTVRKVCPESGCDGEMRLAYESGSANFGCDTCENQYRISAPPILAGAHDPQEDPDVVRRYALTVIEKTTRGFCHLCGGPVESDLQGADPDEDHDHVIINHECAECGGVASTSTLLEVLDHPAVVSVFHEVGVDYREAFFEAQDAVVDITEQVIEEDPVRIEVVIETTEAELTVLLDDELTVTEYTRTD